MNTQLQIALTRAVQTAAAVFREYEYLHLQKGTPDGASKALRNAAYAEEMEAALALAAATQRAKTPTAAECEASQSGPKGSAQ